MKRKASTAFNLANMAYRGYKAFKYGKAAYQKYKKYTSKTNKRTYRKRRRQRRKGVGYGQGPFMSSKLIRGKKKVSFSGKVFKAHGSNLTVQRAVAHWTSASGQRQFNHVGLTTFGDYKNWFFNNDIWYKGGNSNVENVTRLDMRFFIYYVKHTMKIVNSGPFPAEITIYDVNPKNNIRATDVNISNSYITTHIQYDFLSKTAPADDSNQENKMLYTPINKANCPGTHRAFNFLKAKKITLAAGEIHTHVYFQRINRMTSHRQWVENGYQTTSVNLTTYGDYVYKKDFSGGILVEQKGTPVHDSADLGLVSIGPSSLDMVYYKEIKAAGVPPEQTRKVVSFTDANGGNPILPSVPNPRQYEYSIDQEG